MKALFILCFVGIIPLSTALSQDSVDVTFSYTPPGTISSVRLVGEFNGWDNTAWPMTAKGNGSFERAARLQMGGHTGGGVTGAYMYKFFYTGASDWPNDPLNPYFNPNENNNSIIYVQDPTIFHLLPNQLVGIVRSSRPTITAGIFPIVGSDIDTTHLSLRIDTVTYDNLGNYYDFETKKLSFPLPSVLPNGTHKMWLTAGSVTDSATFSVAANPVQIETPPFVTHKSVYVTAGFLIRPDDGGIDSAITSVTISVNGSGRIISVSNGAFIDSTALGEGDNLIVVNTGNGSDSVLVHRVVNHTPWAGATAQLTGGTSVKLDTAGCYDPDGQALSNFIWIDDDVYPLGLNGHTGASALVEKPTTPGEYYFGLIVKDPDGNSDTTRSCFIVNDNGSISNPTIASNPEWAKRARIYFLFPKAVSSAGTLNAAVERLTIIRDMGFNVIWMMPVMVNAYPINNQGGPGYNIVDFYNVAPEYGTNQDFKNFVDQAHILGLKIILDVTPNHSSRFHPWSADAHVNKQKSPYWNWYQHSYIAHNENGLGQTYDADSFYYYGGFSEQLLNFNWTDIDMRSEMINVYKYWIKEFGIDGYRFDVYWGPHRRYGEQYMGKPVRDALKHIKPDILLLAEDDGTGVGKEVIYADYSNGGINGGVDAAYDFKLFFNRIRGFGFTESAVEGLDVDIQNNGYYPGPNSLYMRFMESQDEDRIAYVYTSIDATTTFKRTMPMASTIFTVPGIPMIWNGQEVGKGYGDGNFDSRRRGVIDWNYQGSTLLLPHYQRLAQIRGQFKAFSTQQFSRITSTDGLVYAFTRPSTQYAREDGIVAVNFGSDSSNVTLSFSVSDLGGWVEEGKWYIASDLYNGGTDSVRISGGSASMNMTLPPYGTAIFVLADSTRHVYIPPLNGIESHLTVQPPEIFTLHQNYPNPFNPTTTIRFDVPRLAHVYIRIFNVLGEEIADVADGFYTAGVHQVVWDGRTHYGRSACSGVYFVRLESGTFMDTKKIILLK